MSFIGKTGPTGTKGGQGSQGGQGSTGFLGMTGLPGDIYIGPTFTGPTGYDGYQGQRGQTGDRGDTGITGIPGITGPLGSSLIGSQGPQGERGFTGPTGPSITGIAGSIGPQGSQGYTGYTGIIGITGVTGPTGERGSAGELILYTLPPYVGFTGIALSMPVCAANVASSLPVSSLVNRLNNKNNEEGYIFEDFFTSNGFYTTPENTYELTVELQGGGGGGGGSATSDVGGGGGGSGFVVTKQFAVVPNKVYTVTVGAGGSGGLIGSNGQETSFSINSSKIFAPGGFGGGLGLSTVQGGTGGTGGFGGGGGYISQIKYPTRINQSFSMGRFAFSQPNISNTSMSPDASSAVIGANYFTRNESTDLWSLSSTIPFVKGISVPGVAYRNRGVPDNSLLTAYIDTGGLAAAPNGFQVARYNGSAWVIDTPAQIKPTFGGPTGFTGDTTLDFSLAQIGRISAISNDRQFAALSGPQSGNAAGPTGAVWIYTASSVGMTGAANWAHQGFINNPQLKISGSISFGQTITGATGTSTLLVGGATGGTPNIAAAVIYELRGIDWTILYNIPGTGPAGNWVMAPLTNDIFFTQTTGGVNTLRYFKCPNYVFANAQLVISSVNVFTYNFSYDCTKLYIYDNVAATISIYEKGVSDSTFVFGTTFSISGSPNFDGAGQDYNLLGAINYTLPIGGNPPSGGSTQVRNYRPPLGVGIGGSSQRNFISNGSNGATGAGGSGSMNSNVKSNVLYASGGGFGGGFSDVGASANSGGGGTGRVNTTGTDGAAGYVKIRRYNNGVN